MASPPIPGNGTRKRWTFQSLSVQNRNVHPSRRTQSQNSSIRAAVRNKRCTSCSPRLGYEDFWALALETHHFTNNGRTIVVEQQVEKDSAKLVKYLRTAAAKREVDLHPDNAEYLQRHTAGKTGLLFHTANNTPHLYSNLEGRWLTPRLVEVNLDEEGMGWHSFKRFRKTWLRGQRCLEDINNFWMAHKPCPRSTRIFTRNCNCASMRPSELATDSRFRTLKLLQLYRLSRKCTKIVQWKKQRK
jgi:hypothetical protein